MAIGKSVICIGVAGKGRAPITFIFDQAEVKLGRSSSNDIVFDPLIDGAVSRRHARITASADGAGWLLEDLGSTQGTYLNGRRVREPVPLTSGDMVTLGIEGPTLTVMWDTEDSANTESGRLIRQPSPIIFPLALYGDFSRRYHIYQKIGEGGYGQVWRARRHGERQWIAIKFLRPELLLPGSSSSMRRIDKLVLRFDREAELTRRLSESTDAGIVRVNEAGGDPDEGFVYMILDYVDGRSLDRILSKQRDFTPGLVCRYISQVARTLHIAHNFEWEDTEKGKVLSGIVHRDIKPSNIIIRKSDDRAILCDFGIAAIQEGGDRLTLPQMRVFTYKFTSPEVLIDNTISPATDLWGLAITAYVLLSGGQFPYQGMGLAETLRAIRENQLVPITTHRRDLPEDLVELLHRGLDPDPRKRPATALEWYDALLPYAASGPESGRAGAVSTGDDDLESESAPNID